MDAEQVLAELMNEIASDERNLAEKRIAASFWQKRLTTGRDSKAVVNHSPSLVYSARHRTMVETVADVINEHFVGVEFAIGDLYDKMVEIGSAMPTNEPKSKLTTVLARLADTKTLTRTFRGGGNVPHRYRRAVDLPPPELNLATGESEDQLG